MGSIENIKDGPQHPGIFEMVDVVDNYLFNKNIYRYSPYYSRIKRKNCNSWWKGWDIIMIKFNISGYKGSELGFT